MAASKQYTVRPAQITRAGRTQVVGAGAVIGAGAAIGVAGIAGIAGIGPSSSV
jgi:hypothetical protein